MNISQLQEMITEINVEKGWYDRPVSFGELIALIHSEASEALEVFRRGAPANILSDSAYGETSEEIALELADIVIRTLDTASRMDIDLEGFILAKLEQNKHRPYRHGDKRL